ncbi:uncharacterized protein PGTG_21248 [Puccinia graminis f. sp. tritici CRL 75-36-700-3]|uniref:Uncharacterized protein n=1 Tax=Puccinia graminis f. sp. tritici (strain CRL 75-36-700-3 / race SCCL) TaxID=418459 RepID=H6QQU6_PUCGT|nr:uncharacterized protein PGTG_21248 [Puccinia graminis f. sp. tritici CRL 75-36-700-3]EHS62875.1 hypothetical protein PGTG_21248 [Puccinia graminis f. sp. tritici CRL 75-36-700-3]
MEDLLQWMDDDDDILSSLQTTLSLILKTKEKKKRGGSTPGRREINRNRLEGHQRLYEDYFSEDAIYPDYLFRRRFRMRRSLFLRIVEDIQEADRYFVQKRDAAGRLGFLALQKATAAIRMLAYGCSGDSVDEYLRIRIRF